MDNLRNEIRNNLNNLLKYVDINWCDIYVGITREVLNLNIAIQYAEHILAKDSAEEKLCVELLILDIFEKDTIIKIIVDIGRLLKISFDNTEYSLRKLRYAILSFLNDCSENLLDDIDEVYSLFYYPQDMVNFISYMPAIDKNSTVETLLEKFYIFLKSEKQFLEQKNNIIQKSFEKSVIFTIDQFLEL